MAKAVDMVEIYRAAPDGEIIDTQYGKIPYKKFLELEKARIEKHPNREVRVVSAFGKSFLIANKITGKSEEPAPPWTSLMPKGQKKARNAPRKKCAAGNTN